MVNLPLLPLVVCETYRVVPRYGVLYSWGRAGGSVVAAGGCRMKKRLLGAKKMVIGIENPYLLQYFYSRSFDASRS